MTDKSIFEDGSSNTNNTDLAGKPSAQPNAQPENQLDDLLGAIRNEQGEVKYRSVEDALKGAAHAQDLILKNKSELDQLRSEIQSLREENAEYKGAVSTMQNFNQPSTPEPSSSPANEKGNDEVNHEELVNQLLDQREQAKAFKANTETVARTLNEKFGEKAQEVFYSKASDLGLSRAEMNKLAAQSPKAVLAYFETVKADNINPTQSSTNSEALGKAPEVDVNAPLAAPERSILAGADTKDVVAEMARHKEHVYKKYGVTL